MFSQELTEFIVHGEEETYLEYKDSMPWNSNPKDKTQRTAHLKIVKAMLAMANNVDGGVIVIGAREQKNGEFKLTGVTKKVYDSFQQDDMDRYFKGKSDPAIQFKITRDWLNLNGKKKIFVVIQVSEAELPVVCQIRMLKNETAPPTLDNMGLRENAVYIRAKAPIESRDIASANEWRELIDRAITKRKADIVKMAPHVLANESKDMEKFADQLRQDGL